MATTRAVVRVRRVRAVVRGTSVYVGGGGTGITMQEGGVEVATGVDTINVTGDATVTDDGGGVVTIDVTGGGAGGVTLKDSGSTIGTFSTINVTGPAVVTDAGSGVATLQIGDGTSSTIWNPKAPPASPNAKDDEFDDASLAAKWTEYDPTSILTVTEDAYGVLLEALDDPASQNAVCGIRQAIPTSDEWEIVSRVSVGGTLSNSICGGLYIAGDIATNPTTAPLLTVYLLLNVNGQQAVEIVNLSNRTTFWSLSQTTESRVGSLYLAMQWKVSTGKAAIWYSYSGVDWVRMTPASFTPATVTTASYFGIFANAIDAPGTVRAEYFRVREASSGIIDNPPPSQGARVQVSGANGTGGITAHSGLSGQGWTVSGHTGTASRLAGFNGSGAASLYAIGTDVQAYDAGLASLTGVDTGADKVPYTTAANTWAGATLTSYARTLLDDVDASAARSTLVLVPGTDVQAYDAGLASLTGVDTAADLVPYTTAANTWSSTTLTSYARTLLDDVDASAARTTLGLGDSATRNVGTTAGTVAAGDHTHSTYLTLANALTVASLRL